MYLITTKQHNTKQTKIITDTKNIIQKINIKLRKKIMDSLDQLKKMPTTALLSEKITHKQYPSWSLQDT